VDLSPEGPLVVPWDWWPKPLPGNVEFGPRCRLYGGFAFSHYRSRRPCGVRIGADSGVYPWTAFELGVNAEVRVGSYCSLVGPIIRTDARVEIGDHALIANEVVLADTFDAMVPAEDGSEGPAPPSTVITLGDNVWIGQRAVILGGARIGDGAIIGAGAVIDFPVEPYAIVAGVPARVISRARPRGEHSPALREEFGDTSVPEPPQRRHNPEAGPWKKSS
jgi:acetyltransferase-like isoleucine patch superfamily enzyme